jgi:hypothetical protein
MPDDHSEVVPLLPIPNRTVKRLCADDSAGSRVKVGHRQAITARNAQSADWAFSLVLTSSFKENAKRLQHALKSMLEYKASLITASQARRVKVRGADP